MARPTQITPFVLCSSLSRQIAFYRDALGFECTFQQENYAYMRHGDVAVRLVECDPRADGRSLGADHSFYIDVDGIDALFETLRPGLDGLEQSRVRAPFNQPYGQREFHVLDEDGALVFFGEKVPDAASG